eukprot:8164525-Prorocentrum_lima.AAC.1
MYVAVRAVGRATGGGGRAWYIRAVVWAFARSSVLKDQKAHIQFFLVAMDGKMGRVGKRDNNNIHHTDICVWLESPTPETAAVPCCGCSGRPPPVVCRQLYDVVGD